MPRLLLQLHKNLKSRLQNDFAGLGIVGEEKIALAVYITMTGRLLDEPPVAMVGGSSSSG